MLPPSQAISTLRNLSTLVRTSRLTLSSSHPRSSGTPVSLLPAELPLSYFHASHPVHARPALLSCSFLRSSPQAISMLHIPSLLVRHSCLAPSCGAHHKLFPRFTSHPRSSSTPVLLLPAELVGHSCLSPCCGQATSTLHIPSTLVRHSCLAPSCGAPPKLFPRFTSHPRPPGTLPRFTSRPRSSGTPISLLPAELPPSYFHASHPRSSGTRVSLLPVELPQSYFHASHPVHARLALLSRSFQRSSPQAISTLDKVFPRFTSHPRSSGTPVSLLPAELPPS